MLILCLMCSKYTIQSITFPPHIIIIKYTHFGRRRKIAFSLPYEKLLSKSKQMKYDN